MLPNEMVQRHGRIKDGCKLAQTLGNQMHFQDPHRKRLVEYYYHNQELGFLDSKNRASLEHVSSSMHEMLL